MNRLVDRWIMGALSLVAGAFAFGIGLMLFALAAYVAAWAAFGLLEMLR